VALGTLSGFVVGKGRFVVKKGKSDADIFFAAAHLKMAD